MEFPANPEPSLWVSHLVTMLVDYFIEVETYSIYLTGENQAPTPYHFVTPVSDGKVIYSIRGIMNSKPCY